MVCVQGIGLEGVIMRYRREEEDLFDLRPEQNAGLDAAR